jgi:HAD superfamily hydrolase (TIGR01549 family)
MQLQKFLEEHPKRDIIFDFDKTLFTLHLPWGKYSKEMKERISKLDRSLVSSYPNEEVKPLIIETIKIYGEVARQIINPYRQRFERECLVGESSNESLISFVRENFRRYQMFIWSSNATDTVLRILRKYNLEDMFKKIVAADDVNLIKPYSDGFYLIFDPQEDKRSDFLFIGDSEQDEEASENVGIDFLNVSDIEEI